MNLESCRRVILGLGMAVGLLLAMWAGGAEAQGGGWEWQNPLPQGNTLYGVWHSAGSDLFAVGWSGAIVHYDGAAWHVMRSGTTRSLNSVWGSSASDVFAVGDSGTILHYEGAEWSSMSSGTYRKLTGVWGISASDVFAVGYYGTILPGESRSTVSEDTDLHRETQGSFGHICENLCFSGCTGFQGVV